jgi:hypothetical protein
VADGRNQCVHWLFILSIFLFLKSSLMACINFQSTSRSKLLKPFFRQFIFNLYHRCKMIQRIFYCNATQLIRMPDCSRNKLLAIPLLLESVYEFGVAVFRQILKCSLAKNEHFCIHCYIKIVDIVGKIRWRFSILSHTFATKMSIRWHIVSFADIGSRHLTTSYPFIDFL